MNDIAYRIRQLKHKLERLERKKGVADDRLNGPELAVLGYYVSHDDENGVLLDREFLSETLGLSKPTFSNVVRQLEKKGLLVSVCQTRRKRAACLAEGCRA